MDRELIALILSDGCCTHRAVKAIKRFIDQSDFKRILLDGFSITGVAVRACLGDRFVGFVDTSSIKLIRGHRFLPLARLLGVTDDITPRRYIVLEAWCNPHKRFFLQKSSSDCDSPVTIF